MNGTTLGRYLIVDTVGAGGMGVVYRALDERLERDVAVKVEPGCERQRSGSEQAKSRAQRGNSC